MMNNDELRSAFDLLIEEWNLEAAVNLIYDQAKLGNAFAQSAVGVMLEDGSLVERDYVSAFYSYSRAIKNGYKEAQKHMDGLLNNEKAIRVLKKYLDDNSSLLKDKSDKKNGFIDSEFIKEITDFVALAERLKFSSSKTSYISPDKLSLN